MLFLPPQVAGCSYDAYIISGHVKVECLELHQSRLSRAQGNPCVPDLWQIQRSVFLKGLTAAKHRKACMLKEIKPLKVGLRRMAHAELISKCSESWSSSTLSKLYMSYQAVMTSPPLTVTGR